MPFKSDKQRRWMFANEPEMAKRWANHEEVDPVDRVLAAQSEEEEARAQADYRKRASQARDPDLKKLFKHTVGDEHEHEGEFDEFTEASALGEMFGETHTYDPDEPGRAGMRYMFRNWNFRDPESDEEVLDWWEREGKNLKRKGAPSKPGRGVDEASPQPADTNFTLYRPGEDVVDIPEFEPGSERVPPQPGDPDFEWPQAQGEVRPIPSKQARRLYPQLWTGETPKMESVFRIGEAPVQNRPPPGSQPLKPTEYTTMGAKGQALKQGMTAMQAAGQEMTPYKTPQGDITAFPKDAAPGRGPVRADITKGTWAPMTGSSTGTPFASQAPTTTMK